MLHAIGNTILSLGKITLSYLLYHISSKTFHLFESDMRRHRQGITIGIDIYQSRSVVFKGRFLRTS